MVRRVEPGALVARGERLQHAHDPLPGRRAADQAVLSDALPDLESRAVLAAVDVHGHGHPGFFYVRRARALGPYTSASLARHLPKSGEEGQAPRSVYPSPVQRGCADPAASRAARPAARVTPMIQVSSPAGRRWARTAWPQPAPSGSGAASQPLVGSTS